VETCGAGLTELWHSRGMPGGKLWSISVLVPLCPSQSMTSVAAVHRLVARPA
jgi:hypothetical protein